MLAVRSGCFPGDRVPGGGGETQQEEGFGNLRIDFISSTGTGKCSLKTSMIRLSETLESWDRAIYKNTPVNRFCE